MIAQEILKAQAAFETNGYAQRGFIFRHFAEGWLEQTGVELVNAIAAVDSYIEAAEAEANDLYSPDQIEWLTSTFTGIQMS